MLCDLFQEFAVSHRDLLWDAWIVKNRSKHYADYEHMSGMHECQNSKKRNIVAANISLLQPNPELTTLKQIIKVSTH